MKMKRRSKMSGWIVALIVVAVLGVGGAIGWSFLAKEHSEARSLPLNAVDFSSLNDGIFVGEYEGGMYKWRANKAQVTVSSGKVSDIKLLSSSDPGRANTQQDLLYARVIKEQSLQVDVISGATLTSKGYLQGVENALKQAQK
ncbi:MAG: FMN-binding protein [Candidatus Cryosericum sp.]